MHQKYDYETKLNSIYVVYKFVLLIWHFARPDLRLFRSIVRVVAFSDSTAITSVGIVVVVGAEEN